MAWLALGGLTARADNVLYDLMSRVGMHAPRDDIVIVAIDDRSVRELGRWPWPRSRHAEALRKLAAAGPKAIAYDVLFVEPDKDDVDLAGAMSAAGRVALPVAFEVPGDDGAPYRLAPPVEPIRQAAAGLGHVDLQFDPDGVVRRAMLAEHDGGTIWPHLMEAVYRLASGRPSPLWGRERERSGASGLYRSRPIMIPYAGPPGRFRTIAFVDLLRGETPDVFLKGKIVLVGATAGGLGDRYSTPLSGGQEVMSGVEVQANVLDALLSGRAIRPAGPAAALALSLAPLWVLLLGFRVLRPRANMVLGAGLIGLMLASSALSLAVWRLWLPPGAAILGLLVVYPLWSWRRLGGASAYIAGELRRFAGEPDLLAGMARAGPLAGDPMARDIERLQGALGQARFLRRFVSDVVEGLPDATLVLDASGRVTLANQAARRLFEPLGGSPLGRAFPDLLRLFEDSDGNETVVAAGRTYHLRRERLHDADGGAFGDIVRLTDVSLLLAASRQREQALQLLTHDMRSPQVSILSLLEGAGEQGPSLTTTRRIAAYAHRTLALADGFVQLARAENAPLDLDLLSLGDLMVEAVDELWPQSSAKGVRVEAETGEMEVLIRADRSLLARALINLVGNAVKYTGPGGRVECRVWRDGEDAVCSIADTGPGMAPDQVERLFEPFRRGAAVAKADGAGLGLALVRMVMDRHGARLACDSALGRGTVFTLRFAAVDA